MCAKQKNNKMDPITPLGLIATIIFGGLGIMQLNDPESNILVALFNIAVAMVALFLALRPYIMSGKR